jgi:hypothetical protein
VASISWRRRWLKVTGVAAAVAAVAGAGLWLGPRVRQMALQMMRSGEVPVATTAMPAGQTRPPDEVVARPAVKEPERPAPALVAGSTHATTAPLPERRKPDRGRSLRVAKRVAPPPAEEKVAESAAAEAQEQPAPVAPAPVAAAPPPEPRRVAVEIYAPFSFCDPSLDDAKAKTSPARYAGVVEGEHRVHCTMPSGKRVPVGKVDVVAPTRGAFLIKISKDPNGLPVLPASRTTGLRQPDPGAEGKAPSGEQQPR